MKEKIKNIKDGIVNVLKGLGGDKDSRIHSSYVAGRYIDQKLANDLYSYNWLAGKAIDAPVDDAFRKWRTLLIPDAEQKKEYENQKFKGVLPCLHLETPRT